MTSTGTGRTAAGPRMVLPMKPGEPITRQLVSSSRGISSSRRGTVGSLNPHFWNAPVTGGLEGGATDLILGARTRKDAPKHT